MWRIIDIGGTDIVIHIRHRNMVAERNGEILQSIPMSDINSIVCHGDGNMYSDHFMRYCIENSIPLVLCNEKHLPCGMFLAFNQNNLSASRIEEQVKVSLPRKKNAWRQIVEAKLSAQADLLEEIGQKSDAQFIRNQVRNVLSGDSSNREAVCAKVFFQSIYGNSFSRGNDDDNANHLLDYAYTIIRSAVARAVVSTGLHPGISLFHSNRINPYALVDDLMEPLRPFADRKVIELLKKNPRCELTPHTKRVLIEIANSITQFRNKNYELTYAVGLYVQSYYHYLISKSDRIDFPTNC
ncbi:MAG: type II CRISPR-associated endonuclease Cas1 [Spirochaetales bacterium]|nr:type II CRISPR-associated endonuclease Cas1 [Spirochaetales bacterium]